MQENVILTLEITLFIEVGTYFIHATTTAWVSPAWMMMMIEIYYIICSSKVTITLLFNYDVMLSC